MYFALTLIEKNYPMFVHLASFTRSTFFRYRKDEELDKFLKEHPEYNFTTGK